MKSLKNEINPPMSILPGDSSFPLAESASVLQWAQGPGGTQIPTLGGDGSVTISEKKRGKSVVRGIWKDHVWWVQDKFDGGTDEQLENKALDVLLKSDSYAELAFKVNEISWDVLDDELDENDNTAIAARLSILRDRVEHAIDSVFRGLSLNPGVFADTPSAAVTQAIQDRVTALKQVGQTMLANRLLTQRVQLLDAIALFALRGQPTRSREFTDLLDELAGRLPSLASSLSGLSWEVFYDNLICTQLSEARYRLLISSLPDMVDATLPAERRVALFDSLDRRDDEFRAMQSFINVLGTVQQRTDVERFMDARQLFMDNFTPNPPPANIIQIIAAFFNSVASEINGLRSAVVNVAQGMINSISLDHLSGGEKDDKSREAVSVLGARRAVLAFQWKAELIRMMEEGNCDDDDEQAILQLLTDTKARSIAEFAQLVAAQGWESLSFSFDGQEYDDLELLLSEW